MIKRVVMLLCILAMFSGSAGSANLKPYTGPAETPALKLPDLQGKIHDLADYRGKVVLVQFWATYCTPCRKEMPSMNRMQKKLSGVPFKILAVDMGETKAEVNKFVAEVKPEFTILLDEQGKTIADWRVFAAPSNFIIGPDGKIRYTLYGGVEWDSEKLISQLRELASEK